MLHVAANKHNPGVVNERVGTFGNAAHNPSAVPWYDE